tara:strand:- start:323 stop:2425 length:2103 start_codon:yes stop_codon:yes gene_type:complete
MKKLLLLLFIPIVCLGQDKVNVIETVDFNGYDMYGNYIEKIEKIEVIKDRDYLSKKILWKNTESVTLKRGYLSNSNYLERPMVFRPFTSNLWENNQLDVLITDDNFCSFVNNYKYFTNYSYNNYEGEDELLVKYGIRLLKPSSKDYNWDNINPLFYKKIVTISKNKTVIENYYEIAVSVDGRYMKFVPRQIDFNNYFYTQERNENYNPNIGYSSDNQTFKRVFDDPVSLKKNKSLKEQIKPYIWINIDDKISLGNPCWDPFNGGYNNVPQSVYDKNHIITLNKDFDYSQKIENNRSDDYGIDGLDHSYIFTFGLKDPSKKIDDFDVQNAIEYKLRYISENTYLTVYDPLFGRNKRFQGSYLLEIKKKVKGVFYFDKKIYSEDIWGYNTKNSDRKKLIMYNRRQGLIRIFRSSDVIYLSLNNNLLDKTEKHFFENNTLRIGSRYENAYINQGNIRPLSGSSDYSKYDFKISKTINKQLPLEGGSLTAKSNDWSGNGSGIIISTLGHIVTNYHVIKDSKDIEVEFIINNELQKFNAEVIQSDKVNDLAIIKINDNKFNGVAKLPYNFKTRSSDVGTKVYAYGYPMALSVMGKEIKITDGIISSKSGFDGDITSYQVTAPIQGGNSGGPLFDEKGNFIGINSSGLSKEIADNVGYTIKSSYVLNLIDVLPKSIDLPSSTKLQSLPLTEQIKEISKYVVLVKVK